MSILVTVLIGIGCVAVVVFWACCFIGGQEDERQGWK